MRDRIPLQGRPHGHQQRGSTLFVTMIMLALLMLISTSSINGSMVELHAAGNISQMISAFQSAESGISATMDLAATSNNPFNGIGGDPFAGFTTATHPLKNVPNVQVDVNLNFAAGTCARSEQASSASQIACEYYQVDSVHESAVNAVTQLSQGVSREVVAN